MKKFAAVLLATLMGVSNVYASAFGDKLECGASNAVQEIDVSKFNYNIEQAQNEITFLVSRSENAWNINKQAQFKTSGKKVEKVLLTYLYSGKEKAEKQAFIDKTVENIVLQAEQYNTDYDKAKFVYNYLIDNYDYDNTLKNSTDLDLYEKGTGVCRAFAISYKNILSRLNIHCDVVISKSMSHEWNVVYIDGNWYNVDVSGADLLMTDRECFFLKSDVFFRILGYTDGIAYNNVTAPVNYQN